MGPLSLHELLYEAQPQDRAAIIAIRDSSARDVLRQLAAGWRWDGDLNSKQGRDLLVHLGYAARWQGINFLTPDGYAVADVLYGLSTLIKR